MFNHLHYVPILKWKLGEYQALSRLAPAVKDRITPLLEIPAVGYDFEKHRTSKSLDDHLADFGRRLKAKWQARACFIDLRLIDQSERMSDGSHPLDRVLTSARSEGCNTIPVIAVGSDADYLKAAGAAKSVDTHGVCLRLQLEDFDRPNFSGDIENALRQVTASQTETDLVIDLGDKQFLPITAFVQTLISAIRKIPALNRWRTFSVAGTSYPATLAAIDGSKLVRRQEWSIYRTLVDELGDDIRIPSFGDYGVAYPDPVELDMRLIKPFAKLRYTTPEDWHIAKGRAVRTSGFEQYRGMCDAVTRQPFFDGAAFSDGDRYIAECAVGNEPTGNLTTWVWVSTNRHITRVVADLANFHGA